MRRYALRDDQWERIEQLLPGKPSDSGVTAANNRLFVEAVIRRSGKRVFIRFAEGETKTHSELELELPPETISLLDEFLAEHHGRLPGAERACLFPGETGGARSYSAMHAAVSQPLRRHAGIELSPHLYRHIIAKIVAERRPELLHDVSRMLSHKSMRTTYGSYLGTEGPAASRRVGKLLREAGETKE